MALALTLMSTDSVTAGILTAEQRKGSPYPETAMFAEQCRVAQIHCASAKAPEGHYPPLLYVVASKFAQQIYHCIHYIVSSVFIIVNQIPETRETTCKTAPPGSCGC